MTEPTPQRYLAIKVLMMPQDTNPYGTIFGGVILSYIDQAGAIGRASRNPVPRFSRAVAGHGRHGPRGVSRTGLHGGHRQLLDARPPDRQFVDHDARHGRGRAKPRLASAHASRRDLCGHRIQGPAAAPRADSRPEASLGSETDVPCQTHVLIPARDRVRKRCNRPYTERHSGVPS